MHRKASRQTIKLFFTRPDRNPNVGERIGVYWKKDKRFYAGEVSSKDQDGKVVVNYDDGDIETLNLDNEIWEFENDPLRYRTVVSKEDPESNSGSDRETDESHAGDKSDRDSNENDNEERNTSNGQASESQQEGGKYKRRKTQKTQKKKKIQKRRNTSATHSARKTRRVRLSQEVEELGTRHNMEQVPSVENTQNRQPIENQQHVQDDEDKQNVELVRKHRNTRMSSSVLIRNLPPVKKYKRVLKPKQRGCRNKGSESGHVV